MRRVCMTIVFAAAVGMASVTHAGPYGLSINGVCDVGSCPATTAQAAGASSDTGSEQAILANGDIFAIDGRIGAQNQATGLAAFGSFTVTYDGNTSNVEAASQADSLTVLENYLIATSPTSVYGTQYTAYEQTTGSFTSGVASGSSLANTYTSNGTVVGTYGPYVSPTSIDGPLMLFNVVNGGTWTITDSVAASFAAGSAAGSEIVFDSSFGASPVPLPPTLWLMLAGLGGLVLTARQRNV